MPRSLRRVPASASADTGPLQAPLAERAGCNDPFEGDGSSRHGNVARAGAALGDLARTQRAGVATGRLWPSAVGGRALAPGSAAALAAGSPTPDTPALLLGGASVRGGVLEEGAGPSSKGSHGSSAHGDGSSSHSSPSLSSSEQPAMRPTGARARVAEPRQQPPPLPPPPAAAHGPAAATHETRHTQHACHRPCPLSLAPLGAEGSHHGRELEQGPRKFVLARRCLQCACRAKRARASRKNCSTHFVL